MWRPFRCPERRRVISLPAVLDEICGGKRRRMSGHLQRDRRLDRAVWTLEPSHGVLYLSVDQSARPFFCKPRGVLQKLGHQHNKPKAITHPSPLCFLSMLSLSYRNSLLHTANHRWATFTLSPTSSFFQLIKTIFFNFGIWMIIIRAEFRNIGIPKDNWTWRVGFMSIVLVNNILNKKTFLTCSILLIMLRLWSTISVEHPRSIPTNQTYAKEKI